MVNSLETLVKEQIRLLEAGDPLGAFERFYGDSLVMFDNDRVFAEGKENCRKKQEPFILPCKEIFGKIAAFRVFEERNLSVLHNQTEFVHPEHGRAKINGLHVQEWKDGKIQVERYYRDDMLEEKLKDFLG